MAEKLAGLGAMLLALGAGGAGAKEPSQQDCNASCLLQVADRLLNSIAVDAPDDIPASPTLVVRQDGKKILPGQGIWTNAQAFSGRRTFVDPVQGQFMFYGTAFEGGIPAVVLIRGKVANKLLTEIEILEVKRTDSLGMFRLEGLTDQDALWSMPVPESSRSTREELVARASSYFDSLEAGDPAATAFHPDCFRSENGQWTTNNPPQYPRSCSEGIRYLGPFGKIDYRRFPVVDVERGLVLASVVFDRPVGEKPAERVFDYRGKKRVIPASAIPSGGPSFVYELFKIEDGQIRGILAALKPIPVEGARPWPIKE